MNSTQGNAYMIYRDASWVLGQVLFVYVILPLMALWVIIGLLFNLSSDVATAISVPVYINIIIYAVAGFKPLFPVAIGLGSTRIQYLKAYYLTGLALVSAVMLLLNICQLLLRLIYNHLFGWSNILHPATLFIDQFSFLSYFWVDLMLGLFLFGLTFLIFSAWYRLGTMFSLLILMAIIAGGLFLYYGGAAHSIVLWFVSLNLKVMAIMNVIGLTGLAALFITYPMMRNAPLQSKPRD